MHAPHHKGAALTVATAAVAAALWLLLFVAPEALNAHSTAGEGLAILLYLGVPAGVAWGGTRLWHSLSPKDHDDV